MVGVTNSILNILPDYNNMQSIITSVNVSSSAPYTFVAPLNGWIVGSIGRTSTSGDGYIDINNKRVGQTVHYSAYFSPFTYLLNKGDTIKFYGESGYTFGIRQVSFVPCHGMIAAAPDKLYLFNNGDTCDDITGGYSTDGYILSGYSNAGNISINGNYIWMHPGTSNVVSIFGSVKSFNVTPYKKLYMLYKITSQSGNYIRCGLPTVKAEGYNQEFSSQTPSISLNNIVLYSWDITNLTGYRYMMLNNHDGGSKTAGEIYEIYLEK